MAHFIIGYFDKPQQGQHAKEELLATGFSQDQIDHPFTQDASSDQSAGADVSGLESFVTSIAGDPPPTAVVPDELADASTYSIVVRVRVTDSVETVQAENILRQAGAKTITQAG